MNPADLFLADVTTDVAVDLGILLIPIPLVTLWHPLINGNLLI